MSTSRFMLVFRLDAAYNLRRPLCWILIAIMALLTWGLSTGHARIQSGDSSVGGTKAFITSEFAVGQVLSVTIFGCYIFFVAVTAGMSVIRDEEWNVRELVHATPLRPGEYIWSKFLAVLATFAWVLALHLGLAMFFNHIVPSSEAPEARGPFDLVNYVRPALIFGLPPIVFMAGTAFAIGEWTRKPILVFVLPVAALLFCLFFLWEWSPTWLDPRINRMLMLIDPAGLRWLSETYLKVDRGVEFYNKARIELEVPFCISRLGYIAAGFLAAWLSQRHFARTLRGSYRPSPNELTMVRGSAATYDSKEPDTKARQENDVLRSRVGLAAEPPTKLRDALVRDRDTERLGLVRPLAELGMGSTPPGLIRGIIEVARAEARELRSQAGLYLFVPLILLQVVLPNLVATGAFDTPLLVTPGTLAVGTFNTLTLLVCLLLLFYTVESLQRERSTGIAPIFYATPVRSTAILFGKALANTIVAVVIVFAALVGCLIVQIIQHEVPLDLGPFGIVWGLLLVPSYLLWASFVAATFSITRSRYTTYGIGLAVLMGTGYLLFDGKMNWVGNWMLWRVLQWSDMGPLELSRSALVLNRLLALSLAVMFTAIAARVGSRRDFDAVRIMHRLRPQSAAKAALHLSPYVLLPLALAIALAVEVRSGFQGGVAKKLEKDYWRKNLATWKDAALPALVSADVDLELEPARRWFRVSGTYELENHRDRKLDRIPFTGGPHWKSLEWTMNDEPYTPEKSAGLYVFTPEQPFEPRDRVRIGFKFEGTFPQGITKNGGGSSEFILPAGVVLTTFTPSFVPVLGYSEDVGVDKENRYEPRVYADDYYLEQVEPFVGSGSPYKTRVRVTAPAEYTLNSVGTLVSESQSDGRRTVVWESDYPVRFFNVVAGRWAVRRGDGTAIFYHPAHTYNIDEMIAALDAARQYYSEWFYPFPWHELKLSEFPALAGYAQGFPTNITFSEGIGFLTRSDPKANAAFMVTAHESAHQWWGNLLTPGKGPGGNLLSEGMSHFSTILLTEQVHGLRDRIELCKRFEDRYANERQVNSERPLVKIDGSRAGDTVVTYEKAGWVFWMLLQQMGRDPALAGLHAFIEQYRNGPDYPLLQDLLATLRPFAPNVEAFDGFAQQWFHDLVLPEFILTEARRRRVVESPQISSDQVGGGISSSNAAPDESQWLVSVRVANHGTGRMPVEIAATRGERFQTDGKLSEDYHEARHRVTLGSAESTTIEITCDFEPEQVLVDPDALVLQLRRKSAVVRL